MDLGHFLMVFQAGVPALIVCYKMMRPQRDCRRLVAGGGCPHAAQETSIT